MNLNIYYIYLYIGLLPRIGVQQERRFVHSLLSSHSSLHSMMLRTPTNIFTASIFIIFNLDVDGKTINTIPHKIETNPVTEKLIHIDNYLIIIYIICSYNNIIHTLMVLTNLSFEYVRFV